MELVEFDTREPSTDDDITYGIEIAFWRLRARDLDSSNIVRHVVVVAVVVARCRYNRVHGLTALFWYWDSFNNINLPGRC